MPIINNSYPTSDPRAWISEQEIQGFYQINTARLVLDLAVDWVWILGAIAAWGWLRHPAVLVAAFFIVAAKQHSLNNWVHEASHFSISRKKKLNDLISDIFAATPHLISTADYRAKHKLHHSDLGNPQLDTEIKSRFLITGWRGVWRVLLTLLGASALLTFKTYSSQMPVSAKRSLQTKLRFLALAAMTNGLIFLWCWGFGVPFAWLYLWVLPLVTLTSLFATIRVIAEHQPEEYALQRREQFNAPLSPAITRTIAADAITAFFLSPVKFNYHLEHHTWPAVPYSNLPSLSKLLHERGYYNANPSLYGKSYYAVLSQLIWPSIRKDQSLSPVRE